MAELRRDVPGNREASRKVRLASLAARQWGVVSRAQLVRQGFSSSAIHRRVHAGELFAVLPGVYAVGHCSIGTIARHAAALLYAGPGAALSHISAGWWTGILAAEPRRIHVTTPRHAPSVQFVTVFGRRSRVRIYHRRLPVTTIPQTLLDLATMLDQDQLRKALAEAEYRRRLKLDELNAVMGHGRPGSVSLRAALNRHLPQLAHTRSDAENEFVLLCDRFHIPMPEINVRIEGWLVDAVWPRHRVAVELDGIGGHGHQVAVARDRRKDFALRAAGRFLLRYSTDQLRTATFDVVAEVDATLDARKHRAAV